MATSTTLAIDPQEVDETYLITMCDEASWHSDESLVRHADRTGAPLTLRWDPFQGVYREPGEPALALLSDEQYDQFLSHALLDPDNEALEADAVDEPVCLGNTRFQDELRHLANQLQGGELGPLNPETLTMADLVSASHRKWPRGHHWARLITKPNAQIFRNGATVTIYMTCCPQHRGTVHWSRTAGWIVNRDHYESNVSRRDRTSAETIKELYGHQCMRCDVVLDTPTGRVAEAAHIWEVAEGGPDTIENLLCLCPNCHSTFDKRAWTLRQVDKALFIDELNRSSLRRLRVFPTHQISPLSVAVRNRSNSIVIRPSVHS